MVQRTARRSNRNSTARCQESSVVRDVLCRTAAYSRRVAAVIAPRSSNAEPSGPS